jgi:ankyrin repeat protein
LPDNKQEALLTLVLALALPEENARSMAKLLLSLGATAAQADTDGTTAFHRYVEQNSESLLDTLFEMDKAGSKTALNHIAFPDHGSSRTPLQIAATDGHLGMVLKVWLPRQRKETFADESE